MTEPLDDLIIHFESFFEFINELESGEANSSRTWNWINREARFAERVKAYEKIFYEFLDENNITWYFSPNFIRIISHNEHIGMYYLEMFFK